MELRLIGILVLWHVYIISCQDNAYPRVAKALMECYNTSYANKMNRYPNTMNVLIEMIRHIEDNNKNMNAREISAAILLRYKQDGIKKSKKEMHTLGLPYSPTRREFYKNKILLQKFLPYELPKLDERKLTTLEKCSLHFMISSTVDPWARGDESSVCRSMGRYRVRTARQAELSESILDANERQRSECPIEEGVIYSEWGTVKAGDVLAGIATGFNSEDRVPVLHVEGYENITVDNKYASTIAGELAEASLYQSSDGRRVGCDGRWNSTLAPRYYFLSRNDDLEITDTEIRGGLDGLYLAKYLADFPERESFKVSQILDLYYSPRGLDNSQLKACNRSLLQTQYCPSDVLQRMTEHFCYLLDDIAKYEGTYERETFKDLAALSVKSFNDYITKLNDLKCSTQSQLVQRTAADILVFIDTTWDLQILQASLSYILDNIDVNRYHQSVYRIFSGQGEVITNTSSSILDFTAYFNESRYNNLKKGMDYSKILEKSEHISRGKLDDKENAGGKSTIILIVTHTLPNNGEIDYMARRKPIFKRYIPDLKILIVGSGSKSDYGTISPQSDIFILGDGYNDDNIRRDITPVIERIKSIPRNVVNPKCGSGFSVNIGASSFELPQTVEPQGINFYRIAPNYFYRRNSDRKLYINNGGDGDLMVCTSRKENHPSRSTQNTNCKNVTRTANQISISVSSECSTWSSCDPIYLSVEGVKATTSVLSCKDDAVCRFPDNIRFTIKMQGVQCYSSAEKWLANLVLTVLLYFAVANMN